MKFASYWQATAPEFVGARDGLAEGHADVAIIGGGFTGLSAAIALARKGVNAVLLEAGRVGSGASGRNGGHCNNGLAIDFAAAVQMYGSEKARELYRAFDAGVDAVERLVREERIDCDFDRRGKIKLAAKPQHFAKLAAAYDLMMREVDPDLELVPPATIRTEIGSEAFYGGLVFKKSASMHMGRFVVGLADAAVRRGVRIYENAPVTKLRRVNGYKHEVVSAKGRLVASKVLIATGPSLTGPFRHFRRRIVPIGSFVIATEPLSSRVVAEIMPTRRTATTTRNIGHYFRICPEGRLIFGGRARFAMSNPTSDAKSGRILEGAMRSIFPQLKNVRTDFCWGGLVDMTADRLPRAGEHEGLFYSMGYSGHGTQMSILMGKAMAEVMLGTEKANPLRDLPWPAIPGHFGPPWFLPFVGAYYRLQDWLD